MKYLKLFFLIFLFTYYNCSADTFNPDIFVNNIDLADENKGNIFLSITGYILIFILGCISVIVYFHFRIQHILEEEYVEYKRQIKGSNENYPSFIFGVIQFLKERKNTYKNKTLLQNTESNKNYRLQTLIKENRNLTERNRELEKKLLDSNDIPKNNNQNGEKIILEQAAPLILQEKKANILYFSIAEKDGSFFEDKSTITALARSYYQIEYFEGERTGKLIYRSGNLDTSALSQMDQILGPVCEIENSSITNPTRIIVQSSGTVVKEDDKWKINV
jgi:hypothetical protein